MSHPSPQAKPSNPSNPRVFFDVDIGGERGEEAGRPGSGVPEAGTLLGQGAALRWGRLPTLGPGLVQASGRRCARDLVPVPWGVEKFLEISVREMLEAFGFICPDLAAPACHVAP